MIDFEIESFQLNQRVCLANNFDRINWARFTQMRVFLTAERVVGPCCVFET